jgi:hypothetical protein
MMIETFFHPLNDEKIIADREHKACSHFPFISVSGDLKKDSYMDDVIIG